jgi:hypothetical protein
MRNIDHQHGRCLRLEIRFPDTQIIFLHIETFYAMIDLIIADTFRKIDLLDHIPKSKWS